MQGTKGEKEIMIIEILTIGISIEYIWIMSIFNQWTLKKKTYEYLKEQKRGKK